MKIQKTKFVLGMMGASLALSACNPSRPPDTTPGLLQKICNSPFATNIHNAHHSRFKKLGDGMDFPTARVVMTQSSNDGLEAREFPLDEAGAEKNTDIDIQKDCAANPPRGTVKFPGTAEQKYAEQKFSGELVIDNGKFKQYNPTLVTLMRTVQGEEAIPVTEAASGSGSEGAVLQKPTVRSFTRVETLTVQIEGLDESAKKKGDISLEDGLNKITLKIEAKDLDTNRVIDTKVIVTESVLGVHGDLKHEVALAGALKSVHGRLDVLDVKTATEVGVQGLAEEHESIFRHTYNRLVKLLGLDEDIKTSETITSAAAGMSLVQGQPGLVITGSAASDFVNSKAVQKAVGKTGELKWASIQLLTSGMWQTSEVKQNLGALDPDSLQLARPELSNVMTTDLAATAAKFSADIAREDAAAAAAREAIAVRAAAVPAERGDSVTTQTGDLRVGAPIIKLTETLAGANTQKNLNLGPRPVTPNLALGTIDSPGDTLRGQAFNDDVEKRRRAQLAAQRAANARVGINNYRGGFQQPLK
jgi:hypothetical protein